LDPLQPNTGIVLEWSQEGDQLSCSRDALTARLSQGREVTFAVWFPDGVSVGVSFRSLDKAVYSVGFDLGGLNAHEVALLAAYAIDRFRVLAEVSKAVLLIADPRGKTAEFDWYEFVRGMDVPPSLPEIIGLPANQEARIQQLVRHYNRERIADYVLLREHANPPTAEREIPTR
jgi:hypothetical protein